MAIQTNAEEIRALFPELEQIQDLELRDGVIGIWLDLARETAWGAFRGHSQKPQRRKTHDARRPCSGCHEDGARHGRYRRKSPRGRGRPRPAHRLMHPARHLETARICARPRRSLYGAPACRPAKSPSSARRYSTPSTGRIKSGPRACRRPWSWPIWSSPTRAQATTRSKSYEAALLFYADWADSDAGIVLGGSTPFSAKWVEK